MRPALELRDLLDQVRELVRVELSLFRAEIGERTTGIPSASLRSLWGRSALRLPRAGFGCGQLSLLRFGLPLDLALSHQPFLLLFTCLTARLGFNKFNDLASRQGAAREPLLARCDGVDGARAASGSMKGRAKMVVVRATV